MKIREDREITHLINKHSWIMLAGLSAELRGFSNEVGGCHHFSIRFRVLKKQ